MQQDRVNRASEMRERQRRKISELRTALVQGGFGQLSKQADALGLGRSTTWAVLKASHKLSGLSAHVVNRMIASPKLPPEVLFILADYVREKIAGEYGHGPIQLKRFQTLLAPQLNLASSHHPLRPTSSERFIHRGKIMRRG